MIEDFCRNVITELGATGVLLLGVAFIFWQGTKKLYVKLQFINDELSQLIAIQKETLELWKTKING